MTRLGAEVGDEAIAAQTAAHRSVLETLAGWFGGSDGQSVAYAGRCVTSSVIWSEAIGRCCTSVGP
jgi:hypothetical protein